MADGNNFVPCVIVFKAAKDKATQNTLVYQVAQVTTKCVDDDLRIVDSIVTHGGLKDVRREALAILDKKKFVVLYFYTPAKIAKSVEEFKAFMEEMHKHGIIVLWLRT